MEATLRQRELLAMPAPESPSNPEQLVRRHWGAVRRDLRTLGAQPEVAEDLAQEAFVVALRKGIKDRGAPTGAYLRRTARVLLLQDRRAARSPLGRHRSLEASDAVREEQDAHGGMPATPFPSAWGCSPSAFSGLYS